MRKEREPWRKVKDPSELTKKELEIARLLAEGLSDLEIAKRLKIKKTSVHVPVKIILDKLDVESREAVAKKLKELGLSN